MKTDAAGFKLASYSRVVSGGWDSQRFEIERHAGPVLAVSAQYFTGTKGHGSDTVQIVGKAKITNTPFTLTTSYSPDAFGVGKRYRIGAQAYLQSGNVSAWAWVTVRYLPRFNQVDQESWYRITYDLGEGRAVALQRFDSDFFGDNVTARILQEF